MLQVLQVLACAQSFRVLILQVLAGTQSMSGEILQVLARAQLSHFQPGVVQVLACTESFSPASTPGTARCSVITTLGTGKYPVIVSFNCSRC